LEESKTKNLNRDFIDEITTPVYENEQIENSQLDYLNNMNSQQPQNRLSQLENPNFMNFYPESKKDDLNKEESKSLPSPEENKDVNTSFPKEVATEEEEEDEEEYLNDDAQKQRNQKENENKEGDLKEKEFKESKPKVEKEFQNDEEDKNQKENQQPEDVSLNGLPAQVEDPLEARFDALETNELKQWVVNSTIDKFLSSGRNLRYAYHGYVKNDDTEQEYV
jgi:hypothetical protein